LPVGLAPLFRFGRASRWDFEVAGGGQNEKTPKPNQGPFKRDWIGFSGCSINNSSLELDKTKLSENELLKKRKDPLFLSYFYDSNRILIDFSGIPF
jgi:hypothetical protein